MVVGGGGEAMVMILSSSSLWILTPTYMLYNSRKRLRFLWNPVHITFFKQLEVQ